MKTGFQVVLQTGKTMILFVGCTLLFYYGILWINEEYSSFHRYDEPSGKAMKVFKMEEGERPLTVQERLALFYRMGE
ncbi:YqzK family protein [Shouchella shacheensis]|uniref:YqzK family protein n=1 Tax=Shouchella shacheensis TaxID=1649580 RepID=UPI00073FE4CD|nr:YqzK family protein [Shouchella shacheensis]